MALPNHYYYNAEKLRIYATKNRHKNLLKLLDEYERYIDDNYRKTRRRNFEVYRRKNKKHMNDLLIKWRNKERLKEKK